MANIYNAEATLVNVAGVDVQEMSDGTFVKVKRNKDLYTQKVGSHGDVILVRSADKTGTIEVTIQSTSVTNAVFSALAAADEAASNGTMNLPILVKDTSGSTICMGMGRLKGWPEMERGVDEKGVTWVFYVDNLKMFVGGVS